MKKISSPLDRIRVVLSHTYHPGNIGAVARAMKTMGLSRLYLVNPTRKTRGQALRLTFRFCRFKLLSV
jgi:tRNA C32,U32 (ribose-2'-O)-methylase TrmJ